jgi:hypothetical protein
MPNARPEPRVKHRAMAGPRLVCAWVNEPLLHALDALAQRDDLSRSQVLRNAIARFVLDEPVVEEGREPP